MAETSNGCEKYFHPFSFETMFDAKKSRSTLEKVLLPWAFTITICYVLAIFSIKHWMRNRPRFILRRPLILWNMVLAVFSIGGAVRSWQVFLYHVPKDGLFSYITTDWKVEIECGAYNIWTAMFAVSKLLELVDTLFIVFRKSPLIFLHWYHHVTVLIFTWTFAMDTPGPGKIYMVMNYTVHAFMYSYYGLAAYGYRLPNWAKQSITIMQLTQMMVGCALTGLYCYCKWNGFPIYQPADHVVYSSLLYLSYFLLFAKFYYSTYVTSSTVSSKQQKMEVDRNHNGISKNHSAHGRVHSLDNQVNNQTSGESLENKKHS